MPEQAAASAPSDVAGIGEQAAAAPGEVAGIGAAAPAAAEEVAGVQTQGIASEIAGLLPATGQPVTLFAFGTLAIAGLGLALRRVRR